MARPGVDLRKQVFNRLTVLSRAPARGRYGRFWRCRCECGRTTEVRTDGLTHGTIKSCGCLLVQANLSHGRTRTSEHRAWARIKTRCYNKKQPIWKHYGARGITVCDRWLGENGFENFFADMGLKPSPSHTIERDDVNGNYEPGNCRWATMTEQNRNRRNTIKIEYQGRLMSLKEACAITQTNYYAARCRLKKGRNPFELWVR